MQITLQNTATFADVLESWGVCECAETKASSRAAYSTILTAHLLPELGGLPVCDITEARISTLLREKADLLSPSSVRSIATVLRHTLRYAAQSCGAVGCMPDEVPHTSLRKHREIPILSRRDQQRLEAVLYPGEAKRVGVLLTLCTGLRIGELCALQWGDISAYSGTLTVRRTVQRIRNLEADVPRTVLRFDTPKSASSQRVIPIPRRVAALLEPLRCGDECFVLSGTPQPVEPRTMQNRFKAYLAEAGIEPVNFHALRHTFATRWMEKGFDVKSLSRILGHADVSTTLNIYVHPSLDTMRQFMDQM